VSATPLVVVAERVAGDDEGELALALLADATAHGATATLITWDGGPRVHLAVGARRWEVDDINKWRLPKALVRHERTRALGRRLRQGRVAWWWRRAGRSPRVVVVGTPRPEMEHYLPADATSVERLAGEAARRRGVELWEPRLRDLGGDRVVAGWGPPTWERGIDQFLQLAAAADGGGFVWCHPHAEPPGAEVLHDRTALGLDEVVVFVAADGEVPLPVLAADVRVDCARGEVPDAPDPLVAYGRPGVDGPRFGRAEDLAAAVARA
jgi:hypothetical protein